MTFIKSIIAFMTAVFSLISGFLGIDAKPDDNIDKTFKVKSYVICDRVLDPSSLCSEDFDIITDVILFGVATFDTKGNVTVDKDMLSTALNNIKTVAGDRDIEYWEQPTACCICWASCCCRSTCRKTALCFPPPL